MLQQRLSGCPQQWLGLADVENLPVCFCEASFALRYRSAQEDPLWSVCVRMCVIVSLIRLVADSNAAKHRV